MPLSYSGCSILAQRVVVCARHDEDIMQIQIWTGSGRANRCATKLLSLTDVEEEGVLSVILIWCI